MKERKLRRFYKVDEDENFVKIKAIEDGDWVKPPQSDHGYYVQLSTHKRFPRGVAITEFEDGTNNEGDYQWIEF